MGALVLIGPMGAGKTSIGRRVARAIDVPFCDTDAAIAREHGAIPEIFATHGEEHFRELERVAVREALDAGGVVSLGGGAVLHPETQQLLRENRVVLLTVAPHVVARRLQGSSRPLLQGDDSIERWTRIYEERKPIYDSLAAVTFDTSEGPLHEVVHRIIEWARAAVRSEHPEEQH